mgnify:CR=1 FL=1
MMKKGLYVTATPIGNLGDISERAKEALKAAEYVACEDTRVTRKLFSLLGIGQDKTFIAYEDHSEEERAQKIIDLINREETATPVRRSFPIPATNWCANAASRRCRFMCCRAAAPSFPPFSFRGCRPTALCLPGLFPTAKRRARTCLPS